MRGASIRARPFPSSGQGVKGFKVLSGLFGQGSAKAATLTCVQC